MGQEGKAHTILGLAPVDEDLRSHLPLPFDAQQDLRQLFCGTTPH